MTSFSYFNRPQQMSYHDLCSEDSPPKGIGVTLGLGLKFCIQTLKPPPHFNKSYKCFTNNLCKRYLFAGSIQTEEIEKKIYIKSDFIPFKWTRTPKITYPHSSTNYLQSSINTNFFQKLQQILHAFNKNILNINKIIENL
jgi:hypothetical protein